MKSIAAALGLFLFWQLPSALADQASKNARIEEMIQLTHPDRMVQQMTDQVKSMQMAQLSKMDIPADVRPAVDEMQKKLAALLADRMSWDKFKPAFIRIYDETFTEEELNGIVAFSRSPAGKAMLDKMPLLMQRSMAVGQELMGDLAPEIMRMTEELKQKYQK
jgi:hypothetical protein